MIKFDAELLDDVEEIVKASSAFKADIEGSKFDLAKKHVEKVGSLIDALEKTFDERSEVILGVK